MTGMDDGSGTTNGQRRGITEAAHLGDERTVLLGLLQRQRDLVAWKLRDGTDAALRAVSTPTGLTPHGVVRHLTNVERSWLRHVFADEPDLAFDWTDDDPDGELHVPAGISMGDLLDDYAAECRRCDAVVAASSLDDVSAHREVSLRWVLATWSRRRRGTWATSTCSASTRTAASARSRRPSGARPPQCRREPTTAATSRAASATSTMTRRGTAGSSGRHLGHRLAGHVAGHEHVRPGVQLVTDGQALAAHEVDRRTDQAEADRDGADGDRPARAPDVADPADQRAHRWACRP